MSLHESEYQYNRKGLTLDSIQKKSRLERSHHSTTVIYSLTEHMIIHPDHAFGCICEGKYRKKERNEQKKEILQLLATPIPCPGMVLRAVHQKIPPSMSLHSVPVFAMALGDNYAGVCQHI